MLQCLQRKRRPDPAYMENIQSDISVDMRCTLVDWLVEVSLEFRVVSDTLFLAVSYLDRYLSQVPGQATPAVRPWPCASLTLAITCDSAWSCRLVLRFGRHQVYRRRL